jgi:hypothetical protein
VGKRSARRNRFRTNGANALKDAPSVQALTIPASSPANNGDYLTPSDFDPSLEYVAGYGQAYRALNRQIPAQLHDPKAPEVTFETYRQMVNDPEICSDVRTLVQMALGDGMQLAPAVEGKQVDEDAPEFNQAVEVTQFCERALSTLRKPLQETLAGIVEGALTYGHKTAEITWKLGTGVDANKLVLARIAQKDYRTLDFVVDRFWNHIGFAPRTPAQNLSAKAVIPREKFFHLALHEEDEDPRGRSSIRSVFTAWTFKCMTWPEYHRWLENCALPAIVGFTAPKQPGDVQRNTDGTVKTGAKPLSAADAMVQALLNLKNASAAAFPNGAEVSQLEVVGEGAGFERAINVADSQISKGILYQTLATSEAQYGTRAQSQTHMQVLDLMVWWLKGKVAEAIKCDLIEKAVRYNFGDEALRFCPMVSLGDSERRDWATDATAAVALSPEITDSQWSAVTDQLGLPQPLPGEQPRGMVRQQQIAEQRVQTPAPQGRQALRPRSGAFVSLKGGPHESGFVKYPT